MQLKKINKLIEKDLNQVNLILKKSFKSKIKIISELGNYMINNGGKRIRPILTILSAKAIKYKGNLHIKIAALIELIHIATLLHDDVIDESKLRRGKLTSNSIYGNTMSILMGDFIYTKSFQMMTKLNSIKLLNVMSNAANIISKGEILQLINCNNPNFSQQEYMKVIYSKTACLFEVSAQSSAIIASSDIEKENALKNYGKHFGMAFQIIDDLLDYNKNVKNLNKNIGNDLIKGKITFPLLHAIKNTTPKNSKMIRNAISQGNSPDILEKILEIMHQCNSLEWTRYQAKKKIKKAILALRPLSQSKWYFILKKLAVLALKRTY